MAAAHNIPVSEQLFTQIQEAAEAEHRSPEEVVQDAVKLYLEELSWTKLLVYGQERARELGTTEADIDRAIAETRAQQRGL